VNVDVEEKPKTPVSGIRRSLVWLFLTVLLASALPVFAAKFGYHFLPSVNWVKVTFPYAILIALASSAATLAGLTWSLNNNVRPQNKAKELTPVKTVMLVIFGPILFGCMAYDLLPVCVPMIYSLVFGRDVELHYTVAKADGSSSRRCRRKIELVGLPFMFDEICGVTDEFRVKLRPGSKVVVTGYGTDYGLFPDNIEIE
jgi:hypothetical protein